MRSVLIVCSRRRRDGASLQTAPGPLGLAQRDTLPKGFAVPGWTDEQTRQWLSYPRVSG